MTRARAKGCKTEPVKTEEAVSYLSRTNSQNSNQKMHTETAIKKEKQIESAILTN